MASYAWILQVRPGCEDEYLKRHDEIWPEMTEALQQSGIRNSISTQEPSFPIYCHGYFITPKSMFLPQSYLQA